MPQLSDEHIDFIIKDLHHRGLVLESLENEVIDHVCSAVEEKIRGGARFANAYNQVMASFGHTSGLQVTQRETLQFENHKSKDMLKNYFVVAFRNLGKHRFYTLINVVGLAIGVAACMVIALFVMNELQYDRHHEKANRIHRIHGDIKFGGNHWQLAVAAAPIAEALRTDYPEVESVVRFRSRGSYLIKKEASGDNIKEHNVMWADSTFFEVFTVPVLEGDANSALVHPNSVAISQNIANKFFPGESALGKTLILDNDQAMKVTAVYENMPGTAHFVFDVLIAMSGLDEAREPNFLSSNFNTYVLLRVGTDAKAFEE
jgi:putative ABC transport system permease protein